MICRFGHARTNDYNKVAGITREGAYKALREGSKPRLETIAVMLDALGLTLKVVPKAAHEKGGTQAM